MIEYDVNVNLNLISYTLMQGQAYCRCQFLWNAVCLYIEISHILCGQLKKKKKNPQKLHKLNMGLETRKDGRPMY